MTQFTVRSVSVIFAVMAGLSVFACAGETQFSDRGSKIEKDNGEIRIRKNESLDPENDLRQITIAVQDEDTGKMALSAEGMIDGLQGYIECDGGIKELVTNERVLLSGSPSNCLFKLAAITRNGFIYLPKSTEPFTNFSPGDTGVFVSPNGGEMRFTVVQQLPSPLTASAVVSLKFVEVASGGFLAANSDGKSITGSVSAVGEAVPQLVLRSFETNASSADQTTLVARYECLVPVKGSSDATYTCNGDLIGGLRHWVGSGPETLDIASSFFDLAFGKSKTVRKLNPAAAFLPPGTSGVLNGGIEVKYPIGSSEMVRSLEDFSASGIIFAFGQPQTSSYIYSIGYLPEVHIVSVGEPAAGSAGQIPLLIRSQRPVILALASSAAAHWKISLAPGARVARVILYSKEKMTVTGLPSEILIESFCAAGCPNPLRSDILQQAWLIGHPTLESSQFMNFVRTQVHLETTSVQASKSSPIEGFSIPKP